MFNYSLIGDYESISMKAIIFTTGPPDFVLTHSREVLNLTENLSSKGVKIHTNEIKADNQTVPT